MIEVYQFQSADKKQTQMANSEHFHYPRVSTGNRPLTKKPKDSGYEIGTYLPKLM